MMMSRLKAIASVWIRVFFCLAAIVSMTACNGQNDQSVHAEATRTLNPDEPLVIYSSRKEYLIKPLFDAYTAETGKPIEYITDKAGALIARLQSEAVTTPADLLLTVDAGNVWHADQQGLLAPLHSDSIDQLVPEHLNGDDNTWVALTERSRVIVYASDRVDVSELSSYEDLAHNKWKGRLCLRTSKKVYNQSLVASLIAHNGLAHTRKVVQAWVDNLAVAPFSSDSAALKAVKSGQCDVTLVNTYYFARMEAEGQHGSLKLFWPNQSNRGVHINISAAGLIKHSDNKAAAIAFVEWLVQLTPQQTLAHLSLEFPVHQQAKPSEQVQAWGDFSKDAIPLTKIARHQRQAVQLMDEVGYK